MKKLLLIITLLLPVTCFAQGKTDKQLIGQLRNNWTVYLQTKQLGKATDQYTDDAVFYSTGEENAVGKKAITKLYRSVMKQFNARIKFHSSGVTVSGDLASDSGDYNETTVDNTTHKTAKFKGSYLMVLQRKPDGWKINRIMWTVGK
ncbi:nuclear transport factor 2 family protein [Mucilaginibacter sp.]|uniref:YybH family protein n=1 Tax=Mucilaginibacter sp. TaxID=1882438 RepID=UPI002638AB8D|nr:nuclear transport factor 2 family protein [Mucilaginibacter sp.]MDB4925768.1 Ketosteroid isomerase [Mucilaginibacter sp.]